MICGDFNSRIGHLTDYIPGADDVILREVIDGTVNSYADLFLDFAIGAELCVLNGRSNYHNEFTRIGTTGSSVVDYCLVPHCQLSSYTEFSVKRAATLFEESGCLGRFDPRKGIPDHSLLTWKVTLNQTVTPNYNVSQAACVTPHSSKTKKYDLHRTDVYSGVKHRMSCCRVFMTVNILSGRR